MKQAINRGVTSSAWRMMMTTTLRQNQDDQRLRTLTDVAPTSSEGNRKMSQSDTSRLANGQGQGGLPRPPAAHVIRGAQALLQYQAEPGTSCPLTMTFAAVPALMQGGPVYKEWVDKIVQQAVSRGGDDDGDGGSRQQVKQTVKGPHSESQPNPARSQQPVSVFPDATECNNLNHGHDNDHQYQCPVYDYRDVPIAQKRGITIGMSMTERQGGSDVRANTTVAVPAPEWMGLRRIDGSVCDTSAGGGAAGNDACGLLQPQPETQQQKEAKQARMQQGAPYLLRGHKWFTSAPMCDGFLTLSQTTQESVIASSPTAASGSAGLPAASAHLSPSQQSSSLSCFLVPRWLPNGSRNHGFRIVRLKDKLGDRCV